MKLRGFKGGNCPLFIHALQYYNKAFHFLEQKDWIDFGKEMQKMQSILSKMSKKNELERAEK